MFWVLMSVHVNAQKDSIAGYYFLDAVEIVASDDLDAKQFIDQVRSDTTFYKAFLNLRYYTHHSNGNLTVYNKNEAEKGKLEREAEHQKEQGRFWVNVTAEKTNGRIRKKNGEWRYYTAHLFDHAFYPADTLTPNNTVGDLHSKKEHDRRMDKHKHDIRLMMFNPGAGISGVPIVGKKMGIFDDEMVPYYDYKIWEFRYQDSIPCYAFTCKAKPEFKEDKTVVKDLTSYFRKSDLAIMKREYHLRYTSILFQFDVHIQVNLTNIDGVLVPTQVHYNGFWDVPAKKAEYISFRLDCSNFEIQE